MNPNTQMLSSIRLSRVVQALQDVRELPQQLRFVQRTPVVNASEAEIIARFFGRVQIADLIADDAKANVYSYGRFGTEFVNIPNLKVGANLTQSQIAQLNAFRAAGSPGTSSPLLDVYNRIGDTLLLGIRQRMEALIIAMQTDSITYDRMGIKINGSWGMPADLKVTPAVTWDDAANATPVTDILTLKLLAAQRYGVTYNRATMSTTAFNYMTRTTEFINRARLFFSLNPTISGNVLPLQDVQYMERLAAPVLGMREIELYDARFWSQDTTGAESSTRFLPVNQVLLSNTGDDMDASAMDFANTVVVESQVAGLVPTGVIGDIPMGQYGPISYATAASPDLNPPGVTAWGVARGWPRKFRLTATAVLTVGAFGDAIPVGVVFPQ